MRSQQKNPTNYSSYMDVSENSGFSPKIIHGLIGFSMIFTIHFGGFNPLFLVQHPYAKISTKRTGHPKRPRIFALKIALLGGQQNPISHLPGPNKPTHLSIPPTPTWAKWDQIPTPFIGAKASFITGMWWKPGFGKSKIEWDQIPTDPVNSKLQSSYEMLRFFRGQWVRPLENFLDQLQKLYHNECPIKK